MESSGCLALVMAGVSHAAGIDNSPLLPKVLPDIRVELGDYSPDGVKTLVMAQFRVETATKEGTFDSAERVLDHYTEMGVDNASGAQVLIPVSKSHLVTEKAPLNVALRGITLREPTLAALVLQKVGKGTIVALFDRQPIWNPGPGSDISQRDNREILRRIIQTLVGQQGDPE